jgi:hypothetical protein
MGDTEYPDQRNEHLILFPFCELCPLLRPGLRPQPAVEPHHPFGRRYKGCHTHHGIVSTCRECHDRVERHGWGKAVAILAKQRSGTLDLDWTSQLVGFNIRAMMGGWTENLPPGLRGLRPELADMID